MPACQRIDYMRITLSPAGDSRARPLRRFEQCGIELVALQQLIELCAVALRELGGLRHIACRDLEQSRQIQIDVLTEIRREEEIAR